MPGDLSVESQESMHSLDSIGGPATGRGAD